MSTPFSFDLKDTLSFSVIEGATPITDAARQLNAHSDYYDFSNNLVYPPGHPDYVPTLDLFSARHVEQKTVYSIYAIHMYL